MFDHSVPIKENRNKNKAFFSDASMALARRRRSLGDGARLETALARRRRSLGVARKPAVGYLSAMKLLLDEPTDLRAFDDRFRDASAPRIAGVDEAGRGPLAGPVVAAAVVLASETELEGVADSKTLSEPRREELYELVLERAEAVATSARSAKAIDRVNILAAALEAMREATEALAVPPDLAIVDGNRTFRSRVPAVAVVKGDARSLSIAAASIVAKVTRDRLMRTLAERYPEYGWERNKGYPTKAHRDALLRHGATPHHRQSFLRKLFDRADEAVIRRR
jgi:ribonuclease HII